MSCYLVKTKSTRLIFDIKYFLTTGCAVALLCSMVCLLPCPLADSPYCGKVLSQNNWRYHCKVHFLTTNKNTAIILHHDDNDNHS